MGREQLGRGVDGMNNIEELRNLIEDEIVWNEKMNNEYFDSQNLQAASYYLGKVHSLEQILGLIEER